MNQKLTTLLQQRSRLAGLCIALLGISLLAVSGIGLWNEQRATDQSLKPQPIVSRAETPEPQQTAPVQEAQTQSATTNNQLPARTQNKKQAVQTNNTAASSNNGETSQSAPVPAADIQVALKVNDTPKGSVTLPEGSNQCDVLQYALDDGLISSLTMKYNASLKSYGVYIIDGIGESSTVWWGYKVNGKSPPLGCSHVEAKNGDSVHWEYVK